MKINVPKAFKLQFYTHIHICNDTYIYYIYISHSYMMIHIPQNYIYENCCFSYNKYYLSKCVHISLHVQFYFQYNIQLLCYKFKVLTSDIQSPSILLYDDNFIAYIYITHILMCRYLYAYTYIKLQKCFILFI